MNGVAVFGALCAAPDLAAAVAGLPLPAWRACYSFLRRHHGEHGVSGQVLGVMLVNAADRLMQQEEPRMDTEGHGS